MPNRIGRDYAPTIKINARVPVDVFAQFPAGETVSGYVSRCVAAEQKRRKAAVPTRDTEADTRAKVAGAYNKTRRDRRAAASAEPDPGPQPKAAKAKAPAKPAPAPESKAAKAPKKAPAKVTKAKPAPEAPAKATKPPSGRKSRGAAAPEAHSVLN